VVHTLADEWIDGIARPLLGVDYEAITPDVARERDLERAGGAIVLATRPGSAAQKAGLTTGDVIAEVDGIPLDLDRALTELLWRYRAGDVIKLTVVRSGERFDVDVPLGARTTQGQETP
jgi:S1-C subfamily serine protease